MTLTLTLTKRASDDERTGPDDGGEILGFSEGLAVRPRIAPMCICVPAAAVNLTSSLPHQDRHFVAGQARGKSKSVQRHDTAKHGDPEVQSILLTFFFHSDAHLIGCGAASDTILDQVHTTTA